jgi:hypothetical protein
MRSRRPRTALTLVGLGIVLLLSIVAGQQIGERTIFGATERRVEIPEQTVTPIAEDSAGPNEAVARDWQRLRVVAVATDPGFPDPRVTPPAPASPSPKPSPARAATPARPATPGPSGSATPAPAPSREPAATPSP